MFEKIKAFTDFLHVVFYGDYWFIAWGIIFIMFAILFAKDIPKFLKSIKNKNKK